MRGYCAERPRNNRPRFVGSTAFPPRALARGASGAKELGTAAEIQCRSPSVVSHLSSYLVVHNHFVHRRESNGLVSDLGLPRDLLRVLLQQLRKKYNKAKVSRAPTARGRTGRDSLDHVPGEPMRATEEPRRWALAATATTPKARPSMELSNKIGRNQSSYSHKQTTHSRIVACSVVPKLELVPPVKP